MKKLLAVLAVFGLALTAACSADEPESESDGGASVETEATETEAEQAAEEEAAESSGGTVEGCEDPALLEALAGVLDAAEVGAPMDLDETAPVVNCAWGEDLGAQVFLSVGDTGATVMTKEVLESLGQTTIEDSRFDAYDAVAAVVIGCENASAAGVMGCAIVVYGPGAEINLQVLSADAVTQDQMLDALAAVSGLVFG